MPAKKKAPARPATPSTLAQRLAALDDDQLMRLVQLRPDVMRPHPFRYHHQHSFERLATVLGAPDSIYDVLGRADQLLVAVAAALTFLGGAPTPAELLTVLPADLPPEVLDGALDELEQRLLVERTADDRVHAVPGLAQVVLLPDGYGPPLHTLLGVLRTEQLQYVHDRVVAELGIAAEANELGALGKQALVDALVDLLSDPHRVRVLVAGGPPGTGDLADHVAWNGPSITVHNAPLLQLDRDRNAFPRPPVWLVEHGLVVMVAWSQGMMAREVTAILRDERPLATVRWRAPEVRTVALPDADAAGGVAGHSAATLLERVGRLLADLERSPLPALKSGGVGARTLKPVAKDLGISEREAAFLLDLAATAGLITTTSVLDPKLDELSPAERKRRLRHSSTSEIQVVTVTAIGDRWRVLTPAARWCHLIDGWSTSRRWVELAGRRDEDDAFVPALDLAPRAGDPPAIRHQVLQGLARVPAGQRAVDDTLLELLEWEQAMVWAHLPDEPRAVAAWVLEASDVLGLTVAGTLSPLGRVFVQSGAEGSDAALDSSARRAALIDVARGVLPELTTVFTLQADLTAVAAGPLAPEVISGLTQLAEVESRGAASVFRFSESSLRPAFDAGRTADDILAFLEAHADRGVPQPLRYLVADTERRHGSMRVGGAKSYVRSDDPAVMAEVVKSRKLAKLGLRLLAPTVAVSDEPLPKVLAALRAAGYLPAHEDADGAVVQGVAPLAAHPASDEPGLDAAKSESGSVVDELSELAVLGAAFPARVPGQSPGDVHAFVEAVRADATAPTAHGPESEAWALFGAPTVVEDGEDRVTDEPMAEAMAWVERQRRRREGA